MSRRIVAGSSVIELKNDPLVRMVAEIEDNRNAYVKVGIFGSKNARQGKQGSNASIGAVHEFGSVTRGIPARSFLRVPLMQDLPQAIIAIGEEAWRRLIIGKGFKQALEQLGVLAVSTVQDAFASGGFGKWPALKKATIKRKGSSAILIDSGQLRRSVAHKVYAK